MIFFPVLSPSHDRALIFSCSVYRETRFGFLVSQFIDLDKGELVSRVSSGNVY